jgi:rSAM/selenodomain-associated transferase 2/rSAM/selenodomain-associated transferase 1
MLRPKLIIFTRYPEPGKVKTRLLTKLTADQAAKLHKEMAEFTLKWARSYFRKKPDSIEIRYEGGDEQRMRSWLGQEFGYSSQGPGNLGDRMIRAFDQNFLKGISHALLVGTDTPQLTACHAKLAYESLKRHDVVLVPTEDGGYCLIGIKRLEPALFDSIEWGTHTVFDETLRKAKELGLSVKALEPLQDVDLPEDVPVWDLVSQKFLSIIIPTLNEEKNISHVLDHLKDLEHGEVIVADGGSRDRTVFIAEEMGVKVISSDPGRGEQLNAGAARAKGDILLFLHADSMLPEEYAALVREAMSDPEIVGGAFSVRFQPLLPLLKITQKTIKWRSKIFKLPFGDQALFVRASIFRQLGGFANIPLMEDVEFVKRLRKCGKLAFIPEPVTTSSRLFIRQGVLQTTLKNKIIFFCYYLGISPERLARMYRRGG